MFASQIRDFSWNHKFRLHKSNKWNLNSVDDAYNLKKTQRSFPQVHHLLFKQYVLFKSTITCYTTIWWTLWNNNQNCFDKKYYWLSKKVSEMALIQKRLHTKRNINMKKITNCEKRSPDLIFGQLRERERLKRPKSKLNAELCCCGFRRYWPQPKNAKP